MIHAPDRVFSFQCNVDPRTRFPTNKSVQFKKWMRPTSARELTSCFGRCLDPMCDSEWTLCDMQLVGCIFISLKNRKEAKLK
jgi:hypothetical protein